MLLWFVIFEVNVEERTYKLYDAKYYLREKAKASKNDDNPNNCDNCWQPPVRDEPISQNSKYDRDKVIEETRDMKRCISEEDSTNE